MEIWLDQIVGVLINIVEAGSALVIMIGFGRALWGYARAIVGSPKLRRYTALRQQLGQNLVLALEFQVAADILKMTLSVTWQDMLMLATLVALRTALNYILEVELKNLVSEAALSGEPERQRQAK